MGHMINQTDARVVEIEIIAYPLFCVNAAAYDFELLNVWEIELNTLYNVCNIASHTVQKI